MPMDIREKAQQLVKLLGGTGKAQQAVESLLGTVEKTEKANDAAGIAVALKGTETQDTSATSATVTQAATATTDTPVDSTPSQNYSIDPDADGIDAVAATTGGRSCQGKG